jgi:hypothetical protein
VAKPLTVFRVKLTDAPSTVLPFASFTVAVTVVLSKILIDVLAADTEIEATAPLVNDIVTVAVRPDALAVTTAELPGLVVDAGVNVTVATPVLLVVPEVALRVAALVANVTVAADTWRVLPLASSNFAVMVETPPTTEMDVGEALNDREAALPQTVVSPTLVALPIRPVELALSV